MCFGAIVPLILYCLFEHTYIFFIVIFVSIGTIGSLFEYLNNNAHQYERTDTLLLQKREQEKIKKYQRRFEKLVKYNADLNQLMEEKCKNNK